MTGLRSRMAHFREFASSTRAKKRDINKRLEPLVSVDVPDERIGKEAFHLWDGLPIAGQLSWKLYRHPTRLKGQEHAGCCGLLLCSSGLRLVDTTSMDALMAEVGSRRDDMFTSYPVIESIK